MPILQDSHVLPSGPLRFTSCRPKRRSFNDEKGFGFILPDGGGEDHFVHKRDVDGGDLQKDDVVRFDSEYDERKGKSFSPRKATDDLVQT